MNPSRTKIISLAFLVLVLAPAVFAADPGAVFPLNTGTVSDQKKGSILFYNIYTSTPANPGRQNTRFNITNTSDTSAAFVHLFFVDGSNCSVSDRNICLTQSQTATLLASEQDPGITGYLVAIAVDFDGRPLQFNHLVGDLFVKFESGHVTALGAEALAKLNEDVILSTFGDLALLSLDGVYYDRPPVVLSIDNIGSRADGNDTLLILNAIGGNLATTATSMGPLFGILYDDAEQPHSFTVNGGCQVRNSLSNNFPRTTPRFEVVIPAGQTGWLKIWSVVGVPIFGAVINHNPNVGTSAGAFSGGHNLHKLKLAFTSWIIPVFSPGC